MQSDATIPMHELDVSGLAPEERFPALQTLIRNSRLTRPSDGPFHVHARFWQLGAMLISEQRMDPVTFDRTTAEIAAHGSDHYAITLLLEGRCTFHHGDESRTMGAGGVSLSDFTMVERVDSTAQHSITIQVARPVLDRAVAPVAARGPLPASPELQILLAFCRTLVGLLPEMAASNALRMADVLLDLLAAALMNLPSRDETASDGRVRERVVRHIAATPNGGVTVAGLCDHLNLTRSSLFRAFKRDGGVLAYDRRRRLHALHHALADARERRSITELGFVYGFEDKAHLSRLFRTTFGYSASELRNHPLTTQRREPVSGSVQESYRSSSATLVSENFP